MILSALHVVQAALGAYGLYVSYISITNLLQYEEKTKKAAKYSATAEHQLHKTRTTQASGTLAILGSTIASLVLATAGAGLSTEALYAAPPALIAITLFARAHVSNFWHASAKVPFVDGYNEAISKTAEMIQVLGWLGASWAGTGVLGAVIGY